jgi:hypothetical protein
MSTVLIEALSMPGHKQVEKVVLSKIPRNHNAEIG